MYSNRQVEENRFWAKSLTFGDIHALIAKAEHSRQVLHDALEDLELQERDLRATLRRTEARVAQVRHHRKEVEEMMLMLFDLELLRGCVDEWYVDEPVYVPPPVCAEESMAERGHVQPEWFVDKPGLTGRLEILEDGTTSGSVDERALGEDGIVIGSAPSHELGAERRAEQLGCDVQDDDVAIVSAYIVSAGSLERAFDLIRSELPVVVKAEPVDDGGAHESAQDTDFCVQQAWPQMRLLPLSELKYTQKSINGVFRDGSTLESLLRDLHSRKVDPTRHAGMILEVVKVNGTYYSNDNRRLNVLRDYMHDLGREVHVQCRVFEWHRAYERYLERYVERVGAGYRDWDGILVRKKRKLAPAAPPHPPPPPLRRRFIDHCAELNAVGEGGGPSMTSPFANKGKWKPMPNSEE